MIFSPFFRNQCIFKQNTIFFKSVSWTHIDSSGSATVPTKVHCILHLLKWLEWSSPIGLLSLYLNINLLTTWEIKLPKTRHIIKWYCTHHNNIICQNISVVLRICFCFQNFKSWYMHNFFKCFIQLDSSLEEIQMINKSKKKHMKIKEREMVVWWYCMCSSDIMWIDHQIDRFMLSV